MIILAADPSATQTGVAIFSFPGKESEITCASFTAEGKTAELKCDDWGRKFDELLAVWSPDFVAHETAMRFIAGYAKKPDLGGGKFWTPNSDQMLLPEIQGHLRQACHNRGIPLDGVAVKTWRAELYGKGGGTLGTEAAKMAAHDYCIKLGIKAKNHNEAEAACIAVWCAFCSTPFRFLRFGAAS